MDFSWGPFIHLFLAVPGLCRCAPALSSCGERALFLVVVCGLLISVTSPAVEHRLGTRGVAAPGLRSTGLTAAAHGLSCRAAYGSFLDQGSNSCPLHWQADS